MGQRWAYARSDLVGGQLPRGRADQQRPLVGRVIHPHDIDQGLGGLAEVQVAPAAHSHFAVLNADRRVFVRASFGALRSRMQHGAMPRGATAFARALGGGGTAQRDVLAQAPDQRIVRGGGPKLLDGGNARIHTEQPLLRALRAGRQRLGPRPLGTWPQSECGAPRRPGSPESGPRSSARPRCWPAPPAGRDGSSLCPAARTASCWPAGGRRSRNQWHGPSAAHSPSARARPASTPGTTSSARSNSTSSDTLPRSMARSTRCQPQRRWST